MLLSPFSVNVGTSDTLLLPAKKGRIGIIFSCPPTEPVNITFGQAAATATNGIVLYAAERPVQLWDWFNKGVYDMEIRAIATTSAQQISGYEVIDA